MAGRLTIFIPAVMFITGGSRGLFVLFPKALNLHFLLKKFLFPFQLPKLSVTGLILIFRYGYMPILPHLNSLRMLLIVFSIG